MSIHYNIFENFIRCIKTFTHKQHFKNQHKQTFFMGSTLHETPTTHLSHKNSRLHEYKQNEFIQLIQTHQ